MVNPDVEDTFVTELELEEEEVEEEEEATGAEDVLTGAEVVAGVLA